MKKQMLLGVCFLLLCGVVEAQPYHQSQKGHGSGKLKKEKKALHKGHGTGKWIEEKQEEAIEFLGKYMEPERLEKMKVVKPIAYKHILRVALRQKHELDMLKEIDPERYKVKEKCFRLMIKSRTLAEDYKITKSNSKQKEIKKALESVLDKLFDLKEKDKKFELKKLEKEIEKLKEVMIEREDHKLEIVEQHLDKLLLEKEYMRW